MSLLSKPELKALLTQPLGKCISIYMPTYPAGPDVQQGSIRLKNLLREAEQQLLAQGLRRPEVTAWLQPARELELQNDFWQHQDSGLSMFVAHTLFQYYSLPFAVEELVVVAERFHIKPLLPLFRADGRFYVLALSQNEIRLYEGTRDHVREMELTNAPKSLAEVLKYDVWEKQLQFHTDTQAGVRGERPAIYFSHGGNGNEANSNLARYFHQVNEGLCQLLRTEHAPLVLAGVDYLLPIYREVNDYANLMDEGIVGNPEVLRPEDLQARAWPIVQPIFQQEQQRAEENYRRLEGIGSPQASTDVKAIIPAARYGRVETLFVALGQHQWGVFDPATQAVHIHSTAEPGDEDLLDFAAAYTFLDGGKVYALEPEQMPSQTSLVATFRY